MVREVEVSTIAADVADVLDRLIDEALRNACGEVARERQYRARATLWFLFGRGMLDNIERADSFGCMATGRPEHGGRVAFYVRGATEMQRRFDCRETGGEMVFVDLDCTDDVAYILAEREELRAVYGVDPVVIYRAPVAIVAAFESLHAGD